MKTVSLLLAFSFALALAASAQDRRSGFDEYRNLRAKNIFDPNRRSARPEREPRQESRSRSNWIALTGTMVTSDKSLAFFNSSRSDGRKVAAVGETVADFKIVNITPYQVEWERDGKRSVLAVGKQADISGTTVDTSEPAPAAASDAASPPGETSSGDGTATPPAPPAPAGGSSPSDILRKMMERRQKELSSK